MQHIDVVLPEKWQSVVDLGKIPAHIWTRNRFFKSHVPWRSYSDIPLNQSVFFLDWDDIDPGNVSDFIAPFKSFCVALGIREIVATGMKEPSLQIRDGSIGGHTFWQTFTGVSGSDKVDYWWQELQQRKSLPKRQGPRSIHLELPSQWCNPRGFEFPNANWWNHPSPHCQMVLDLSFLVNA